MDITNFDTSQGRHFGLNIATWSHSCGRRVTETVTVHKFQLPDVGFRKNIPFHYYATKSAIARLRSTVIPGTDIEVRQCDLDADGIYEPPLQRKK